MDASAASYITTAYKWETKFESGQVVTMDQIKEGDLAVTEQAIGALIPQVLNGLSKP